MNLIKLVVNPIDGSVEAFYTFTGSDGKPQNSAMPVAVDATALMAAATQQVNDAIAQLGPGAPTDAALVAAVTQLGNLKAQTAAVQKQLDALNSQIATTKGVP
jgi:hypothetical protein